MRGRNPSARPRVLMIIPSRGRPQAALDAARSALETRGRTDTEVMIAIDGDSERYGAAYLDNAGAPTWELQNATLRFQEEHRGMVATLNAEAVRVAKVFTHIGFMGDDHRILTPGWDTELAGSAGPVGIAYGDDLNMGAKLPTAVVMSSTIIRTLGYMAPPALDHLYVDDFWRELGARLGRLAYRDDIVIEHLHPTVGKSAWDEQYRRVNSYEQFARDEQAWATFRDRELPMVVHKIKRTFPELYGPAPRNTPSRAPRPIA
jgi:hypothetical protein